MKDSHFTRRDFFYLLGAAGLLAACSPASRVVSQSGQARGGQAFSPTPSNTLGPFYKRGAPRRDRLVEPKEAGALLLVAGRVINTRGEPLPGAKLEVFHADDRGEYDMEGFRHRGEIPVGAGGEYRFETVMPGHYGGRSKHIHYLITAPGHARLVTQLYFENDPVFGGDPDKNYSRDNLVQHRELIRPVSSVTKGDVSYSSVSFDICLEKS